MLGSPPPPGRTLEEGEARGAGARRQSGDTARRQDSGPRIPACGRSHCWGGESGPEDRPEILCPGPRLSSELVVREQWVFKRTTWTSDEAVLLPVKQKKLHPTRRFSGKFSNG